MMAASSSALFCYNEIAIKGGYLFTADRDLVWSPVKTHSMAPIGEIAYRNVSPKRIHDVNMFFSMGEISSPISEKELNYGDNGTVTRDDTLIMGNISYSCVFAGAEVKDFQFYAGAGMEIDFQMVLGNYPLANAFTSLNLEGAVSRSFGKHEVGSSFSIPVLTYMNRPPFTGCDDEIMDLAANNIAGLILRGKPTSIWDYFNIRFSLEYNYPISNHFKISSELNLGYTHADVPRDKWLFDQSLLVGLIYNFEGVE